MSESLNDLFSEYGVENGTTDEYDLGIDLDSIIADVVSSRGENYEPVSEMETTLILNELFGDEAVKPAPRENDSQTMVFERVTPKKQKKKTQPVKTAKHAEPQYAAPQPVPEPVYPVYPEVPEAYPAPYPPEYVQPYPAPYPPEYPQVYPDQYEYAGEYAEKLPDDTLGELTEEYPEENDEYSDFELTEELPAEDTPKRKKRIGITVLIAILIAGALLVGSYFAFSYRYTVCIDGKNYSVRSLIKDSEAALKKTDAEYEPESLIETEENGRDIKVTVTRPFDVTFLHDGKTDTVSTTGALVRDLLPVALNEYDTVSVPLNKEITAPTEIKITRVTVKTVVEEEITPSPIEDRSEGASKTVTKEGEDGLANITYLETYRDGILSDRKEISREVIEEATPTVILSLEYNGDIPKMTEAPENYKEIMIVECTAYSEPGGYTATGKLAMVGYVAVDPTVIPYHTKMFICSPDGSYVYGYAQAEDCGGAVKGNIVDLYMDTEEECIQFGRRPMIAYILE